jgi:hypothetical protein
MKVYKVALNGVGPAHVEADRYEEGDTVKFFRGDSVIAEYPSGSVQEITLSDLPSGGGSIFIADASE